MDQTHLKLETQFTQPVRQITMMLAVVAMTTTVAIDSRKAFTTPSQGERHARGKQSHFRLVQDEC